MAGARHARRCQGARGGARPWPAVARGRDRDLLAALRRARHRRRRRRADGHAAAALVAQIPRRERGKRAAPQGMEAPAPRPLADVAVADADPLSAAAGIAALAHLRPGRHLAGAGTGARDGSRTAGRRARLARDLRRGRARPGRHRTGAGAPHHLGEDRSGHGGDRGGVCPVRGSARLPVALPRAGGCTRHRARRGIGDAGPALVPQPGQAQPFPPPPSFLARGDVRGGILLDQLGGHRRACRSRHLARRGPRSDRDRHVAWDAADQPTLSPLNPPCPWSLPAPALRLDVSRRGCGHRWRSGRDCRSLRGRCHGRSACGPP